MSLTGSNPVVQIHSRPLLGSFIHQKSNTISQNSVSQSTSSNTTGFSSPAPTRPLVRAVKLVRLHTRKTYIPRKAPARLLPSQDPNDTVNISSDSLKATLKITRRILTENGNHIFELSSHNLEGVQGDLQQVPASRILDYVSHEEIHRFEIADYEEEAERERVRILTTKPRGRPKKRLHALNSEAQNPVVRPHAPPSLKPGGYAAFREPGQPKRRGRPVGWRKNLHSVNPNVVVPSFDGPRPTGEVSASETSTRDPSEAQESMADETPMEVQARTGVYSMVAASRLVPIEPYDSDQDDYLTATSLLSDHEEIAAEQAGSENSVTLLSRNAVPSSRRDISPAYPNSFSDRRVSNSTASSVVSLVNTIDDDQKDERRRDPSRRQHPMVGSEEDDAERITLLEQFTNLATNKEQKSGVSQNPRSKALSNQSRPVQKYGPVTAVRPADEDRTPTKLATGHKASMNSHQPQTPSKSLKRKSFTPHFPGSNGKIPRPPLSSSPGLSATSKKFQSSPVSFSTSKKAKARMVGRPKSSHHYSLEQSKYSSQITDSHQ